MGIAGCQFVLFPGREMGYHSSSGRFDLQEGEEKFIYYNRRKEEKMCADGDQMTGLGMRRRESPLLMVPLPSLSSALYSDDLASKIQE